MSGDFFQNMAPNAKRSFVVTVVLSAIAVVLYMFCVQPSADGFANAKVRLEELQGKQHRTNLDLKRSDTVAKDIEELEASLKPYRDAMLVPLLESYAMRAKSLLDPLALGAGLSDITYNDEKFRALPLPTPMPRQLQTRAAVKVTATGSYQQAVSFLLRLEKEMPLVSLRQFEITMQQDPRRQSVSIVLEWPAKGGLTRK